MGPRADPGTVARRTSERRPGRKKTPFGGGISREFGGFRSLNATQIDPQMDTVLASVFAPRMDPLRTPDRPPNTGRTPTNGPGAGPGEDPKWGPFWAPRLTPFLAFGKMTFFHPIICRG